MTCRKCQRQTCKKFGYFGKRRIQRWRCNSCKSTFCEPHTKLTRATMISQPELAERAIQCLLEGCSIRSTERLTGLNRNTIMILLLAGGKHCERLMQERMRNLSCKRIQVDEIWTFVQKKDRRVRKGESSEFGDQWVFVAMDADTKLIPTFRIGKRAMPVTTAFCWDLYNRLTGRVQLTTDGFPFYQKAVKECFGLDVDFAQLIKLFGDFGQHDSPDARYSPPRITEVISKVRLGTPDPDHISTSFVERQNLTMRMA